VCVCVTVCLCVYAPIARGTHHVGWMCIQVCDATGIVLTDSLAMVPGASVSGMYFAAPESRYFATGKIAKDQVSVMCDVLCCDVL